ncbi:MAG: addiction module protein [Bacteroidetes bacterium]|nr:addiction module protein [Bacteroidota bacterium]
MDIRKEIGKLSKSEKILLVEEIWDEIAKDTKTGVNSSPKGGG